MLPNQPAPTTGADSTRLLDELKVETKLAWLDANYGSLSPGQKELADLASELWSHIQYQAKVVDGLAHQLESLRQCVNVNDQRLDRLEEANVNEY